MVMVLLAVIPRNKSGQSVDSSTKSSLHTGKYFVGLVHDIIGHSAIKTSMKKSNFRFEQPKGHFFRYFFDQSHLALFNYYLSLRSWNES